MTTFPLSRSPHLAECSYSRGTNAGEDDGGRAAHNAKEGRVHGAEVGNGLGHGGRVSASRVSCVFIAAHVGKQARAVVQCMRASWM